MMEIIAYIFFIFNIFTFFMLAYKITIYIITRKKKISLSEYYEIEKYPTNIGILIPAWNEGEVLKETIMKINDLCISNNIYCKIFLATYYNDIRTLNIANHIKRNINNLHIIINRSAGPTTKAENLLNAFRELSREQYMVDYILLLDAESRPNYNFFEYLSNIYIKNNTENSILQTSIIQFPFESKTLLENILGRSTYISQSYIQWLIDLTLRSSKGDVLLKGTGIIFPFEVTRYMINFLKDRPLNYLDRLTELTEDTKLSIKFKEIGYNIKFLNNIYILEDSPGNLKIIIKRYVRWFIGNFSVFLKYNRKFIKYFFPYFMQVLATMGSVMIYLGYAITLFNITTIPFLVMVVNTCGFFYYLFIPASVATVMEFKIPEIYTLIKYERKYINLIYEFIKNIIATIISYLIIPIVVILGLMEMGKGVKKGVVRWYKTERR